MSNKKFIIEKEVEWKSGETKTWYYIKFIENNSSTFIDLTADEEKAYQLFEKAVNGYVAPYKQIIKEYEIEESK